MRTSIRLVLVILCTGVWARAATPMLQGQIDRPLRYTPQGTDFVIVNGELSFNRPMYGGNTAFRADGGDKPEFSLFLPGRGGNLRVGLKIGENAKWLSDAANITARYHGGTMVYEVRDPAWERGTVRLTAVAAASTESLLVRAQLDDFTGSAEWIWAYGGANGERGSRNGDIGTERQPVTTFFALRPEYCQDNQFQISANSFLMESVKAGRVAGIAPAGARLALSSALNWSSAGLLLSPADEKFDNSVIVGRLPVKTGEPLNLALQRLSGSAPNANAPSAIEPNLATAPAADTAPRSPTITSDGLSRTFDEAMKHFEDLSRRVSVDTPDPFINAAAAAICVAADGVWDSPNSVFMHGAVAWRNRYLGWRGAYSGDALGWHERTPKHLDYYFKQQNVTPVDPNAKAGADADTDFARSEAMLHTNGDMMKSHYDMNMVAVDAWFRHALWTNDREYIKATWPVIKRDLEWEHRLFRREFGPDKLPLYEAYACIWASDDLQYEGGGVTHSSAYNYWHHIMAARIAEIVGEDPAPYRKEAELIYKAMHRELWLADRGWYAEFKDLLGTQLVHPNAAVWTHYHTIDSHAADPFEAWQMGRFVDTQIVHIPVKGPGVPAGYSQLATSTWVPYAWSTNNVVMAETVHTALADFQAGRSERAFSILKGAYLDSMCLGQCPGNLGMCTWYDANRRESQRDFADACGTNSRALVEGLFGIAPDALDGELTIQPGFPGDWDHSSIKHPDLSYSYKRDGSTDTFVVESKFARPMKLKLRIPARGTEIGTATVNGQPAIWKSFDASIAEPRIEVSADAAQRWEIIVRWQGVAPATVKNPAIVVAGQNLRATVSPADLMEISDPQKALAKIDSAPQELSGQVAGTIGHRTVFAKVHQGQLTWWMPVEFEIRPHAGEVVDSGIAQDDSHLRFRVRNNTAQAIDRDVTVRVNGKTLQAHLRAPAAGESDEIAISSDGLMPGSNAITIEGNDIRVEGVATNWKIKSNLPDNRWETVDLSSAINDNVTQIFRNDYLEPRSPFCSLAIPKHGIGGWAGLARNVPQIDDSGLRAKAAQNNGRFVLPNGVPFATPGAGDSKNIAFTSQWNNYPRQASVPLSGKASHVYLLMAGSTNNMQSRFDNGEVVVTYDDGTVQRLALENPTTWWPIERDFFVDDFAFARPQAVPPRVDLRTGNVRVSDPTQIKGRPEMIPGGAATVLDMPLASGKALKSLTVRTLANEVVIGIMAVTLERQ